MVTMDTVTWDRADEYSQHLSSPCGSCPAHILLTLPGDVPAQPHVQEGPMEVTAGVACPMAGPSVKEVTSSLFALQVALESQLV